MKIDPNDYRLTAYALGELAESEKVAFETELAGDPAARQEVDRIRRAAGSLTEQLQAEPCPRLEPAQRNVIYEKFEPAAKATGAGLGWFAWLAGAAALVVVGALMLPALSTSRHKGRELTQYSRVKFPASQAVPADDEISATPPAAQMAQEPEASKNKPVALAPVLSGGKPQVESELKIVRGTEERTSGALAKNSVDTDGTLRDFEYKGLTLGDGRSQVGKGPGGIPTAAGTTPSEYKSHFATGTVKQGAEVTGVVSEHAAAVARLQNNAAGNVQQAPVAISSSLAGPSSRFGNTLSGGPGGAGSGGGRVSGFAARTPSYEFRDADTDDTGIDNSGRLYPQRSEVTVAKRKALQQSRETTVTGNESYPRLYDNPFYAVADQPLSTFGLDVDTASYSNIRRFLLNNQLPPPDAVRIEEMLNYFTYDYPTPHGKEPFALYVEMGECPWNPAHQLALVGLKAKDITAREQPPLNLVFLIDVSGSMQPANKLPLIKQALRLLVNQLDARDRVSIVVYANSTRVALPSTRGDQHRRILSVIDELNADGGTNGGDGIQKAYAQASENFIKGGVNRVILCTDGDFNVGITDQGELTRLIQEKAKSGVFLSVFGFGMGNLKDSTMQKLANSGNGHYAYLDDIDEARKVLVDQARSTIITVAKDVKLQVEFNPAQVQAYRLIGYEKRQLAARDFNSDRKDAGEMGAGHTVTALYEIVPAGEATGEPGVDPLKYQPVGQASRLSRDRDEQAGRLLNAPAINGEWATVKLRYKEPDADTSKLLTTALKNTGLRWRTASDDFQFASAVAAFGMLLRDSQHKADANLDLVVELAQAGRGRDVKGYRTEFIDLAKRARNLAGRD